MPESDEMGSRPDAIHRRPKVMFGNDRPDAAAPARPDAQGPHLVTEARPAILFGAASLPSRSSGSPKVLAAGTVRRRLPVTREALAQLDASATTWILKAAIRVVDAVNLDDHHFDDVVRFGSHLQAEHARLTEGTMRIASAPALAEARTLAAGLLGLMEELDPSEIVPTSTGIIATLRSFARSSQAHDRFELLAPQVEHVAQEIRAQAPELRKLSDVLHRLPKRYDALDAELAAHVLGGRFVLRTAAAGSAEPSDREHVLSQLEALESRVSSLEASRATVAVGKLGAESLARGTRGLTETAESLLIEDLPTWRTAYTAALVSASGAEPTGPAMTAVRAIHERITSKLREG